MFFLSSPVVFYMIFVVNCNFPGKCIYFQPFCIMKKHFIFVPTYFIASY